MKHYAHGFEPLSHDKLNKDIISMYNIKLKSLVTRGEV